jgi:hypothetical protein
VPTNGRIRADHLAPTGTYATKWPLSAQEARPAEQVFEGLSGALYGVASGSPFQSVGYPLPPGGDLGRKILIFNSLRGDWVCKILILHGLCLKYLDSAA